MRGQRAGIPAELDALRFKGDPLADGVVADLVATGRIADLMTTADDVPKAVRDYLVATRTPPEWADDARIARAHELFLDSEHAVAALSYGAVADRHDLSRVLNPDGQPHRTLSDTARFALNLLAGGAVMSPIQRTRLIHAAVRYLVSHSPDWDDADGVPICQLDLLDALTGLSARVVERMRARGVAVTAAEAEDYCHVWRVVGAMLGIRADLLPVSLADTLDTADCVGLPKPRGWSRLMRLIERPEDTGLVAGKVLHKAGRLVLACTARTLSVGTPGAADFR